MTRPWRGASPRCRLTRSGAVPPPPQPPRQPHPHQTSAAPQVEPTASRVAAGGAGAAGEACPAGGAASVEVGAAGAGTVGRPGPRLNQCWRSPMPATSPGAPPDNPTFPSPPSAARPRALCAWRVRSRTSPCRAAISVRVRRLRGADAGLPLLPRTGSAVDARARGLT